MDEKPSSSWDDLLNEIGATPAPDALERRRPAIETHFDPPPAAKPVAKPKPGNWGALASELGVDVPEEPPAGPSSAVGPGAIEASFAAIEPLESDFEEIIEEEIADIDFAEADDDGPLFADDDSDLDDDSSVIEEAELDDSDEAGDEFAEGELGDERDDPLPPSALSGEAARSAFEALFQAGATGGTWTPPPPAPRQRREPVDDLFEDMDRPPRKADGDEGADEGERRPRRRRRRGRGGRGSRDGGERPGPAAPVRSREGEGESDDWTDAGGEESRAVERDDAEAPGGEEPREGRSRRRRSRRGGRSRTSGEEQAPAGEARAASRNGRPAKPRPPVDEDDDAADDDLAALHGDADEDDEEGGSASRSTHKSIPSWSEAIGVMVDVNMQARKNSPQRPSGGGRGGEARGSRGGRGRGRGGRGRGRGGDGGGRSS